MQCFVCGEQIREDARFCPYCGKDQSERPAEHYCVHCGQEIGENDKFCGTCGGDQSKLPEPIVEEVPAQVEDCACEEEIVMEELVVEESVVAETAAEETVEEEPVAEETVAEEPAVEEPVKAEPAVVHAEPAPAPIPTPAPAPTPVQAYQPPVQAYQPPAQAYQPPVQAYQPPVQAYQPPAQAYQQPAPVYQQAVVQQVYQMPVARPAFQLPTHRALWKMILLSILTLGIYPIVIFSKMSMEINVVASRHDGKWTMHFFWMWFLAPLTLCIYPLVWIHGLCNRIGGELLRRRIDYKFNAGTFWLWNLLYPMLAGIVTAVLTVVLSTVGVGEEIAVIAALATSLIAAVGPFVYLHKHMKAMNLVNADYNERG